MRTMKILALTLVLLVAISGFSACTGFAYDNTTILAKITAIDGQTVSLIVSEMTMDGNRIPESFGDLSGMGNMPSMPNGQMPSFPNGMGDMPFPNGQIPDDLSGMQIPDFDFSGGTMDMDMDAMFHDGCDTITLTLNADVVKTLAVDDIVQISFGDKGSINSLTEFDMESFDPNDLGEMTLPETTTAGEAL